MLMHRKKKDTDTLKSQLEYMEALILASSPATLPPYNHHTCTFNGDQGDS